MYVCVYITQVFHTVNGVHTVMSDMRKLRSLNPYIYVCTAVFFLSRNSPALHLLQ